MGRRKRLLKEEIHEFPGLAFPAFDGLEAHAGGWAPRVFGNLGPLHVEIGAGRGAFLRALARALPEVDFVALELKPDRATRIARGIQEDGLRNVRVLCGNASHLHAIFAPGEIERFWVNFPDPWPKARAVRKRVLQTERLRALRVLAAPGARLHLRTDSAPLHAWVQEQLAGSGWHAIEEPADDPAWCAAKSIPTEYELAFRREARATYYLHLEPDVDSPAAPERA
jgi:tRNA (guanine-N7-)-methyltransferase